MSRPGTTAQHITPYDRFSWSDTEVERLLASGEQRQELTAYLGQTEYLELARLARKAARVALRDTDPHVVVVPGILGSQLGIARSRPLPNDVLWLDPIDIQVGRLGLLALDAGAPIIPLGAVLYSHLRLRLHLRAAGFAVTLHDYDWRLGIEETGASLAERLRGLGSRRVAIVAHSMGGLLSRTALALPGMQRVERVVLLGTPNLGSFAPVQALRGTYAVVRKIARLDGATTAERLTEEVFNSFPSLYQMVPVSGRKGAANLLDPRAWPDSGPALRATLFERARRFRDGLGPPDHRFVAIAGVGQETVTAASKARDGFVYTITRRGDGTVPADSAALDGANTYFANAAHSDLTRDTHVASAIVDILRKGSTKRLPTRWTSNSRAQARVSDRELRRTQAEKVDWASLTPAQRRDFLQNLNEPLQLRLRVPASRSRAPRPSRRAAGTRA
ncbi:MAG TPA: alpha/beta fold hydrolase [Steroidobacteraceae bacterium]|nr:alpha/beta fold hydrolase [Steroidobacteraceae bacterium]